MQGMVFKRLVEGDVSSANSAKVVVYSCPLDLMQTETKVGVKAVVRLELELCLLGQFLFI